MEQTGVQRFRAFLTPRKSKMSPLRWSTALLLCRAALAMDTLAPMYYPFGGNTVVEGLSAPLYDNNYYLFYHSSSFRGAGLEVRVIFRSQHVAK
eukprot:scaffold301_cov243-Pinguiococcus_pyrenoidosus.AAC.11